jgi:predicted nucleotide-binding protein (sugar kinase/HSP70/actin superfamily)
MKVSFPNLGNTYIAAKSLFDDLDIEYVLPEPSSKRSLDLGSPHSPEEICLPFKIMVGDYLEAIKKGADTIIITGSCGPCRYGEYCELQRNILKKLGYKLDLIVVDSPFDIGISEFLNRIRKISDGSCKSSILKLKALQNTLKVLKLIDNIEIDLRNKAGFEKYTGSCKKLLRQCKSDALKSKNGNEMIEIMNHYKKLAESIEIDSRKNPIRIAIVGEIYTILEPFTNLYIEDKLMDLGVSTWRGLYPSWWVKNALLTPLKLNSLDIKRASKAYLPYNIGGHGRECIGETILAYERGFDGVIQIFPFGCMPEIVSKSILPTIAREKDFPIMTLVVDELTGEAGYMTRIEAFLDLIERRKKRCII